VLKSNVNDKAPITLHGFLIAIAVEGEKDPPIEAIMDKIAGSMTWVEGIGQVDCEYLGPIEAIDEDEGESGPVEVMN